jgi:capsular polysaccharide biosynthesis protein
VTAFAFGQKLPVSGFGEKLYITRENATRRRVSNEGELWAQLERRGFVKLSLEAMSWREQVAAFAAARVVVAPHGAGLANVVFCREGTRVVEFFNRSYVNPCFERWARAARLDYRAVVPAGEEPVGTERRANREDIAADIAAMLAALK